MLKPRVNIVTEIEPYQFMRIVNQLTSGKRDDEEFVACLTHDDGDRLLALGRYVQIRTTPEN